MDNLAQNKLFYPATPWLQVSREAKATLGCADLDKQLSADSAAVGNVLRIRSRPPAGTSSDGASQTRTGDLLGAIQALFQLSYSPAGGPGRIVPKASQTQG